jgi:hypothetical protein
MERSFYFVCWTWFFALGGDHLLGVTRTSFSQEPIANLELNRDPPNYPVGVSAQATLTFQPGFSLDTTRAAAWGHRCSGSSGNWQTPASGGGPYSFTTDMFGSRTVKVDFYANNDAPNQLRTRTKTAVFYGPNNSLTEIIHSASTQMPGAPTIVQTDAKWSPKYNAETLGPGAAAIIVEVR